MWQPHALVNYRENSLVHPLQMAGIELQTTNWGSKALSIPTLSRSSQHCIDIIDFSLESGRRSEQGGYLRAPRSKSHLSWSPRKKKKKPESCPNQAQTWDSFIWKKLFTNLHMPFYQYLDLGYNFRYTKHIQKYTLHESHQDSSYIQQNI